MMPYSRTITLRPFVLTALAAATLWVCQPALAAGEGLSPSHLVADTVRSRLYVTAATAPAVLVLDTQTSAVIDTFALTGTPAGMDLSPDGKILYLVVQEPEGQVLALDALSGEIKSILLVGHMPADCVLDAAGRRLYVANRFDDSVSVLDLVNPEQCREIAVSREPVALALSPDGKRLVVANCLPSQAASDGYVAAIVSLVDTESGEVTEVALPNGSTSLAGAAVSPDGAHAYVTHILARYQLPTTQLERGWVNTNALTIIDLRTGRIVGTVLLDDVDYGAANPWGVLVTEDNRQICVTHAGTHEISLIDREALHRKLAECDTSKVMNDLAFVYPLRQRIRLNGNGPRNLAQVGDRLLVANYFSDDLESIQLKGEGRPRPQSISLGPKQEMSERRWGEALFHDATLCFQQWQSCASCHPGEGRVDALNWDLLNDGLGNPRNTKSLLLSLATPPSMITGIREDGETAVRAGIRHILFAERPEAEAEAMEVYLRSLQPVSSPHLFQGQPSVAAQRGAEVFEEAGCAYCHPAPLYTDLEPHRVGTGSFQEDNELLDTPTLVEIWRTAPYLNDGRAVTLHEVITRFSPEDEHGATSELSPQQVNDLVAFLLTL